jgi:glutamate formiminotransferase
VHADADHHRAVLTLGGTLDDVETATRSVVAAAVARIDIRRHVGVHPRLGAADVVPVVPLRSGHAAWRDAVDRRDRLADWIGDELGVPCFLYGTGRSLPDIRRSAFRQLTPDTGPPEPHPTAGATAVGVRPPLVAYNLWLVADSTPGVDVGDIARQLAAALRGPAVRALGLTVGPGAQVSCNLLDASGPTIESVYDSVAAGASARGCRLVRAEVVGLVPRSALDQIPARRWSELGLADDVTIERRWLVASGGGPEQ